MTTNSITTLPPEVKLNSATRWNTTQWRSFNRTTNDVDNMISTLSPCMLNNRRTSTNSKDFSRGWLTQKMRDPLPNLSQTPVKKAFAISKRAQPTNQVRFTIELRLLSSNVELKQIRVCQPGIEQNKLTNILATLNKSTTSTNIVAYPKMQNQQSPMIPQNLSKIR